MLRLGGEEADVPPQQLTHLTVRVEVWTGALGVHELDVVAVEERVLHDLPVHGLIEDHPTESRRTPPAASTQVRPSSLPPASRPRPSSAPRVVDDPDETVTLDRGQADQRGAFVVDRSEGVAERDVPQRAVATIGPRVIGAGERSTSPSRHCRSTRLPRCRQTFTRARTPPSSLANEQRLVVGQPEPAEGAGLSASSELWPTTNGNAPEQERSLPAGNVGVGEHVWLDNEDVVGQVARAVVGHGRGVGWNTSSLGSSADRVSEILTVLVVLSID